jgi:hypothetical protein
VLACASATDRAGLVIALQVNAREGVRSAAFPGVSQRPLRQCLENAFSV